MPLGRGPCTAAPNGGTGVLCGDGVSRVCTPNAWKAQLDSGQEGACGVGKGEALLDFSFMASRGEEEGATPGQARLPSCLPPSAGLGDPRIAPPPRAAPHLPLPARPATAALSPPSPRSQSFRLRICTCGGPSSNFPTPRALRASLWRLGGTPPCQSPPGAGKPGAGQRGALTCRRFGSSCLAGCDPPAAGRQQRGDLRGFRAERPGASCAPLRVPSQPPARFLPGSCKRKRKR